MNDAERKLVEALRSGRYAQAGGALRKDDAFCCLGVACDLFAPEEWHRDEDGGWLHLDACVAALPSQVQSSLGWNDCFGGIDLRPIGHDSRPGDFDLAGLNDARATFSQIADVIEAGLVVKA